MGLTSTFVLSFPISLQEGSANLNMKLKKKSILTLDTCLRERVRLDFLEHLCWSCDPCHSFQTVKYDDCASVLRTEGCLAHEDEQEHGHSLF